MLLWLALVLCARLAAAAELGPLNVTEFVKEWRFPPSFKFLHKHAALLGLALFTLVALSWTLDVLLARARRCVMLHCGCACEGAGARVRRGACPVSLTRSPPRPSSSFPSTRPAVTPKTKID